MKFRARYLAPAALLVALAAAPAYAERVKGFGDYAGNALAGGLSPIFEVPWNIAKGAKEGMDRQPLLLKPFGLVGGALRGITYGTVDSLENAGKGIAGYRITSEIEELGDVSSEIDSTVVGRVAATMIPAGVIGAITEVEIFGEAGTWDSTGIVGGLAGVNAGIEEVSVKQRRGRD